MSNVRISSSNDRVLNHLDQNRVSLKWKETKLRQLPSTLVVDSEDLIEPYTGFYEGANLCTMGSFSYSHSSVVPSMKIGRYCAISWGMRITGPKHPYEWATTSNLTYDRNAFNVVNYLEDNPDAFEFRRPKMLGPMPTIGNDVWIGQNVSLNRGITIGTGAVIAAWSVVTKDIPPYAIVGGNPARIIKYRFPEETIEQLLKGRWWEFEAKHTMRLDIENIDNFVAGVQHLRATESPYTPNKVSGQSLVEIQAFVGDNF